jgi:hypothetical protein
LEARDVGFIGSNCSARMLSSQRRQRNQDCKNYKSTTDRVSLCAKNAAIMSIAFGE